ncbi:MAG: PEP-CTERM sorting domain-containing protein [Verrucomicrobiota bacterium]|nr:PEP-CTERM sorting domain-containing protein [Verrucomicrobiota bacterium]
MKKILFATSLFALLSFGLAVQGAPVFTETFSYPDGPLLGQGVPPWTITGTNAINPLQVSAGMLSITNTGQDAFRAFNTPITPVDGTSFYYGLTLNLSAAQATGDYFVHTTPSLGNTSSFYNRLFAQSSGAGYVLGYLETSGAGGAVTYGTTVLAFGTPYNVTVAYDFVAGPLNDTARVYVNPTSTNEFANTPYLSDTWTTITAEATNYAAFNIRQGSATAAPTLTVDNINVSTVFGDVAQVAPVPEPSTFALIGLGSLVVLFRRRLQS